MDSTLLLKNEERNQKVSAVVSIVVHLLLFLLLTIHFFSYTFPPPPPEAGIQIAFGDPDESGPNDDILSQLDDLVEASKASQSDGNDILNTSAASAQSQESAKEISADSQNEALQEVSDASATKRVLNNQKDYARPDAASQKINQKDLEEQRKREEAEQKKNEYEEQKKKFSDLLGKGSGSGQTGNQGDPSGTPDSRVLDNISTGTGIIGGGLDNRSVLYTPVINENSQQSGRVVVAICIDKEGIVTEARFTQRGSTTTDAQLVRVAERAAKKYRFSAGNVDLQCGQISIDFVVK